MNGDWVKIVGFIAVIVVGIFLVGRISKPRTEPQEPAKTFYDVVKEDDKRLRADIEGPQPEVNEPAESNEQPVVKDVKPKQQEIAVEPLSPDEDADASKLFEMALAQRKMGRLPGVSYKLMVDYCREIIARYPKSMYALKAKRMLADIPQRYRRIYGITDEEINTAQ